MTATKPPGVPPMLYTRHIAAALDTTPNQVKYWLDSDILPHRRLAPTGQRFVTPADLILFSAQLRATLDWEAVLNLD